MATAAYLEASQQQPQGSATQDSEMESTDSVPQNPSQRNRVSTPGSIARKRAYADLHHTVDLEYDNNHDLTKTQYGSEEDARSGKRSRTADWPLQEKPVALEKRSKDQKSCRKSQSPQRRRHAGRFNWSSRFKEGSMHDRPSNQPPIEYIGQDQFIQEQLMEQYIAEGGDSLVRISEDTNADYDAGIQSTRPSSMYRFGKALVNAFNPMMVWHGLNGKWKEKMEEESNPEKDLLEQRRAKAETAYAELKRVGYPGTQGTSNVEISSTKLEHDRAIFSSRDSAIDVDSYRSSSERKRDTLVVGAGSAIQVQQPISGIVRSASPGTEISSGLKSSLHRRKPSFSSLKKVKSHLQLPTSKRQSASPAPIPSIEVDDVRNLTEVNTIRKQLSKKDLQKQQKLTKKVSDLETKLEKARRELHLSMDDIPPVPPLPSTGTLSPFVPGAMASLPSERLLSEHLFGSTSSLADPTISPTERMTGPDEADIDMAESRTREAETPAAKKDHKLVHSTPRTISRMKRKNRNSEDTLGKPALNDEQEVGGPTATKDAYYKGRGHHLKSQKIDLQDSPRSSKGGQNTTVLHEITNCSLADHSTINKSSTGGKTLFDPAKVDRAKMLTMRSNPESTVPFGKLSDDICNLRKEFPNITNDQIINYISMIFEGENQHPIRASSRHILPTGSASVSNTSDVRQERPPILNYRQAVSPSTATPKLRRSISPPPNHDRSGSIETNLHNSWAQPDDDIIRVSPSKKKNVPPVPKVPKELEGQKATVLEEVAEKEEWHWDDDVF